jgi:hypothetical protein
VTGNSLNICTIPWVKMGNKERRKRKKVDEGIFEFSKVIESDSCSGGPVCHVRVTCYTISWVKIGE